ncbi:iron complex transport system permease protein [Nonomuraea thailandensis]|uniref:Iron complex transport system permease protein n=1 Tax=Nonomuraea thailandensis TaxID=1188745 RepID=A0A9X2GBE2_9ACTN|nr:iron ABC transporter permease [Nonomuraea thailandensis]MCP2356069.1 iron complex transport system permease protein [Nonomuraea thailandensis]
MRAVAAAVVALIAVCLLSLSLGARAIPLDQVAGALAGTAGDRDVLDVIWSVRVPRTLIGLLAGAALGLSGALMQALTRNPLADPGVLGASAGAAFAVVLAIGVLGVAAPAGFVWFAFAGALVASVVVYGLAGLGRDGMTPVKLALAGVATTFLLSSVTSAFVLVDPESLSRYRFWSAGSLSGAGGELLPQLLPFAALGAALALTCGPALNSLALGDDVARGLGRRVGLVRLRGAAAVMLLTGSAVAAIGPVVFVGLVVPYVARALARGGGRSEADHRLLLPLAALLGPCLLLAADVLGRVVAPPIEVQAGLLVAFVGGPFFVVLARRRRLAEL